MTPSEAAVVLGCCANHVRYLIRNDKIKAVRVDTPHGHTYEVEVEELTRYNKTVRATGWPRGKKRGAK